MPATIAPRSGLAIAEGLHIGDGVVDSDYRGELKVITANFDIGSYFIKAGDKIAQLIFKKIAVPIISELDYLSLSTRDDGFGSTWY